MRDVAETDEFEQLGSLAVTTVRPAEPLVQGEDF
jgi:hypothetical protein